MPAEGRESTAATKKGFLAAAVYESRSLSSQVAVSIRPPLKNLLFLYRMYTSNTLFCRENPLCKDSRSINVC